MKQIKDILIKEIKEGKNWKVNLPSDLNIPMEEWKIQPKIDFDTKDRVAYSAIFVCDNGDVVPLVLIKEVGNLDYGGDYCEYKQKKWKQLGLEPNPNTKNGKEYVANPLKNDPSFDSNEDLRKEHRKNFLKWIVKLGNLGSSLDI